MGVWIETPECPKLPGWKPVTPCMGVWIETQEKSVTLLHKLVTPCMGVWIETLVKMQTWCRDPVTPCMGVWIETPPSTYYLQRLQSHPVWVCGLKHRNDGSWPLRPRSHTLYGCVDWNSDYYHQRTEDNDVTPCMGVWIETWRQQLWLRYSLSHPSWVCGLKHNFNNLIVCQFRSWWFFIHYQQRNWQNRAIFLYLTPKLSGISEKIFKFAFKYNIL